MILLIFRLNSTFPCFLSAAAAPRACVLCTAWIADLDSLAVSVSGAPKQMEDHAARLARKADLARQSRRRKKKY
jgi:hypothetical protein